MPMLGPHMSSTVFSALAASGFVGTNLLNLTLSVGVGTVNSLVGLAFSTTDIGSVPGVGVGTGVGLTGPSQPSVSASLQAGMIAAFGQGGDHLADVTDALADGLIQEIALASLLSNHVPVFAGVGTVVTGSISAPASQITDQIEAEGLSKGFVGEHWGDFCEVVGSEFAAAMALATGTVTIAGSPTGIPVVPGAGVGSGSIS